MSNTCQAEERRTVARFYAYSETRQVGGIEVDYNLTEGGFEVRSFGVLTTVPAIFARWITEDGAYRYARGAIRDYEAADDGLEALIQEEEEIAARLRAADPYAFDVVHTAPAPFDWKGWIENEVAEGRLILT